MPKILNLIGERFGRLVVKADTGLRKRNSRVWHCQCDCGNFVDVPTRDLKYGNTKSCGCLKGFIENVNINLAHKKQIRSAWKEKTNLDKLNSKAYKNNRSGIRGVTFNRRIGKWRAFLQVGG